jgi:ubiquinone/menaquinone biosynthesis C-methylase UbiE
MVTFTWPDVETSSEQYAQRFSGEAGSYLLRVQDEGLRSLIERARGGGPIRSALDVGGGHGQLIEALLDSCDDVTIVGSDPICAQRLLNGPYAGKVAYRSAELLALPYDDHSIDLVTSIRLLAHMTHWHVLIAELCRVSARYVIVDYPTLLGVNAFSLAAVSLKRAIEPDTQVYRSFWPFQINRIFVRHGFRRRAVYKQFTAPMALHRLLGARMAGPEKAWRRIGLTKLIGNPVLALFERTGR